jgi:hypothetical protein
VVWCGVVWCGVVWCGVVWCGVVVFVRVDLLLEDVQQLLDVDEVVRSSDVEVVLGKHVLEEVIPDRREEKKKRSLLFFQHFDFCCANLRASAGFVPLVPHLVAEQTPPLEDLRALLGLQLQHLVLLNIGKEEEEEGALSAPDGTQC